MQWRVLVTVGFCCIDSQRLNQELWRPFAILGDSPPHVSKRDGSRGISEISDGFPVAQRRTIASRGDSLEFWRLCEDSVGFLASNWAGSVRICWIVAAEWRIIHSRDDSEEFWRLCKDFVGLLTSNWMGSGRIFFFFFFEYLINWLRLDEELSSSLDDPFAVVCHVERWAACANAMNGPSARFFE